MGSIFSVPFTVYNMGDYTVTLIRQGSEPNLHKFQLRNAFNRIIIPLGVKQLIVQRFVVGQFIARFYKKICQLTYKEVNNLPVAQ